MKETSDVKFMFLWMVMVNNTLVGLTALVPYYYVLVAAGPANIIMLYYGVKRVNSLQNLLDAYKGI